MGVCGTPDGVGFSIVYLVGGRVTTFDCVNYVRDDAQDRTLAAGCVVEGRNTLANPAIPLKRSIIQ